MNADAERVRLTLDALVDEAYRKAIDSGEAITNPDAWRRWKRGVYVALAKREGAGYLRKHHQRLGLSAGYAERVACAKCGGAVVGNPTRRDDDEAAYCSWACAGVQTMTLAEWIDQRATPEQAAFMRGLRRINDGTEAE